MSKKKRESSELPVPLSRGCQRFDRWRRSHRPRARFSEELWSDAVMLAREYGHNRTARALGLGYYALKRHIAATSVGNGRDYQDTPSFVELIPLTHSECTLEIEDGKGGRMGISLKGGEIADLVSLIRNFRMGE